MILLIKITSGYYGEKNMKHIKQILILPRELPLINNQRTIIIYPLTTDVLKKQVREQPKI